MTDISFEEMMGQARQCLDAIRGIDEFGEGDTEDAIMAGEPLAAIESALDAAGSHPELKTRFPDQVRRMSEDPEFIELEPFREYLDT